MILDSFNLEEKWPLLLVVTLVLVKVWRLV